MGLSENKETCITLGGPRVEIYFILYKTIIFIFRNKIIYESIRNGAHKSS